MMLRVFTIMARTVGILVGCFVLVFSTLDVFGLIPHSYEMPSVTARVARYIALLVFAAAFLIPYRRATTRARQLLAKAALGFMVVWTLYISVRGLYGYAIGDRAWQVIPLSIVFCTIVAANLFAFTRLAPKPRDV
ncbi:MAG: hypothetical protein H0X40_19835 [Chthoniobacterales bacterium]|nr:hypothetical protein [Chthoniobacterales bacterium]